MTDITIDTDTEKITLMKVAWIIDAASDAIKSHISLTTHALVEDQLLIAVETLEQLRSAIFLKFEYQEPGKLC